MLLGFTEFFLKIEYHLNKFCQVLPSFPELNRYFLDFKPFQGVLPNFLATTIRFTGFLPSFPKFHRMVPGFTRFSWNLPSFLKIECHWNKLPSFPSSAEALASNSINLIVSDCNFFWVRAGRPTWTTVSVRWKRPSPVPADRFGQFHDFRWDLFFFYFFFLALSAFFFLCWLLQDEKWISIHQRTRQDHRSRRLHDRIFIHKIKVDQQIEAK